MSAMPGFEFVGREPRVYRIVGVVAVCLFAALWLLGFTSPWWAPRSPDPIHSYPVHFKGGVTYYYAVPVGWFVDNGLWVCFSLLAALLVVVWLYRSEVRRVQ